MEKLLTRQLFYNLGWTTISWYSKRWCLNVVAIFQLYIYTLVIKCNGHFFRCQKYYFLTSKYWLIGITYDEKYWLQGVGCQLARRYSVDILHFSIIFTDLHEHHDFIIVLGLV